MTKMVYGSRDELKMYSFSGCLDRTARKLEAWMRRGEKKELRVL